MPPAAAPATPEVDPRRTHTFDTLLGNAPIRNFLRRAWREGRLPQALLLSGPAGIGKTSLAYALAREIAATGEGDFGDPATHRHALKVQRATHPDIITLPAKATLSGAIPVDDVREMEDRIATMPLESPRKIVIVEPAENLNVNSANALLKLLEEPPSSALFILISSDANRLLTTIRSRCTVLELRPVPIDELTAWLLRQPASVPADPARAELAAKLSEGRPGYALSLLQGGMLERRAEVLGWLTRLAREGFACLFAIAERFAAGSGDFSLGFGTAMTLLRDALALTVDSGMQPGVQLRLLNADLAGELATFAQGRRPAGLLAAAEAFERAAAEAPYFYGPGPRQLFCEALLMQIGPGLRAA